MFSFNTVFLTDEEIQAFVDASEKGYEDQILRIADDIKKTPHIKFLTLSGPTCSGKTTTSYILERELEAAGFTVKIVSIDDFYRDRSDISDDEKPDYESISAIDFDAFSNAVTNIRNGETALLPIFDFHSGRRTDWVPYKPSDHEIVVFEGIQAIYPEIVATLPRDISKSIYICVEEDANLYGKFFDRREVRFYRRLVRDFLFRNAEPKRTLELWEGVVQNEKKNIIPNGEKADYIINSFLPYELFAIKPFLLDIVRFDLCQPREKILLDRIKFKFEAIPPIPERFIPQKSVFREFIGKAK